ncbi:hypothetical protein L1049_025052 [Liquidambar formosana]|uniref:Uncharacterized protein n=1 Tax=Liquidambar formosana TaxID=63359 RepID=A0AAP0X1P5_LIQFO
MRRWLPESYAHVGLLKHGGDIYTPEVFEIFWQEFEKSLDVVVNQYIEIWPLSEYQVSIYESVNNKRVSKAKGIKMRRVPSVVGRKFPLKKAERRKEHKKSQFTTLKYCILHSIFFVSVLSWEGL